MIQYPTGYFSNYNPSTKDWKAVAFNPKLFLQSAELNDLQRMLQRQAEDSFSRLFKEGQFDNGGKITTLPLTPSGIEVTISAGTLYALGFWHDVPESTIEITGIGLEVISLVFSTEVITGTDDPDIKDPVSNAEAYGLQSADRLQFTMEYALNNPNGITIATFQDGQLVIPPTSSNGLLDQILEILALRTREQSGSFIIKRPQLTISDPIEESPQYINLNCDYGVGYIRGYRRENGLVRLPILRPLDGTQVLAEPKTYLTANKVYSIDHSPIKSIDDVLATLLSPTIGMTRGGTINGQDGIPSQYTPVASVVSVVQGATTYVAGTDYTLASGYISWLPGGAQPATGTSYNLVVQYTKILTQGTRTQTLVSNESVVKVGATNTLANTDLISISAVKDNAGAITYVEGVDYTYVKNTGVITWIGLANATYKVTYSYWAHTVEGDYVGRDSFVTSLGNSLFDLTPIKTPTGVTVDFKSQISFDTTGNQPVDSTSVYIDYTFVLPRIDILCWRDDGLFQIVPGKPALKPVLPSLDNNQMPVVKIKLTAEATAANSGVTFENYDNQTLLVTELRDMLHTIQDIQFNLAQFQLESDLANQPTATNKIGIFADNFAGPDKADVSNVDFAGTFDFLGRKFILPRNTYQSTPTITSSGATKMDSVWVPTFTESVDIKQPFRSAARVINKYGFINNRARLSISQKYNAAPEGSVLTVTTIYNESILPFNAVKDPYLMSNIGPNTAVATKLGIESSSETDPWFYNKVQVNNEWRDVVSDGSGDNPISAAPTNTNDGVTTTRTVAGGYLFGNAQWAQITKNVATIVGGGIGTSGTISISGSLFIANEGGIIALFNGRPVALTAVAPGVTETDPTYDNSVKANNSGNWSATFPIPSGTKAGLNKIEVYGHDPSDYSRVVSVADTSYTTVANMEHTSLTVKLPTGLQISKGGWFSTITAFGAALGIDWVTAAWQVSSYTSVSLGHVIAAGISVATKAGTTVTNPMLVDAIAVMMAYTDMNTFVTGDAIQDMADAASLTSTDIQANALLIQAASKYAKLVPNNYVGYTINSNGNPHWLPGDPLAQTFTLDESKMITSIELYFSIAPAVPVIVALSNVENGIPTGEFIATAALPASSILVSATPTTNATKFSFGRPIPVEAGKEYAFIVITDDTAASIWTAVLGQKDSNDVLITKNPSAGAALESPNVKSWQLLPATDLQFNINTAVFTNEQTILNLGLQTFSEDCCFFALNVPFRELGLGTDVTFQYSTDNVQWISFSPMVEVELGGAFAGVYLRVLVDSNGTQAPIVLDSPQLMSGIYLASGAYVHREFSLPSQNARYFDIYVDTKLPGGTSAAFKLKLDGGAYVTATENVADRIILENLSDGDWVQRHYEYDAGLGNLKQDIRTKAELSSSLNYQTPAIRNYRVIAR